VADCDATHPYSPDNGRTVACEMPAGHLGLHRHGQYTGRLVFWSCIWDLCTRAELVAEWAAAPNKAPVFSELYNVMFLRRPEPPLVSSPEYVALQRHVAIACTLYPAIGDAIVAAKVSS